MKRDVYNTVFYSGEENSIWQTFEGERKPINEIDHQHLSNIYYYMKHILPGAYEAHIVKLITNEIAHRFEDVLLPYRPLRRFKQEMDVLQKKGWLWPKPSGIGHNIIINGEWVGEVDESLA